MGPNFLPPPSKKAASRPPSVRIKRKVKIAGEWKFATIAKKGDRYLWDYVMVDGAPHKVTGGSFFLEWVEPAGRKIQRSLRTTDPLSAIDAKAAQESLLTLQAQGLAEYVEHPAVSGSLTLKAHFDQYLDQRRHSLGPLSVKKYRKDLDRFLAYTTKRYVIQVTREDILSHVNLLIDGGMTERTAKSDSGVVLTVCRAGGATIKMEKGDWPRVVKKEVQIYAIDELKQLLEHADAYEKVVCTTLLKTGLRDRELIHLAWSDVNWKQKTISVTRKPEYGFRPKNHEERLAPVPDSLLDLLREHRKTQPEGTHLIFSTKKKGSHLGGNNPDKQLLEKVKALAFRAGLNCERCHAEWYGKMRCCKTEPICKQWFLHKFRATFITEMLRSGVDLRTVQMLAGHRDIKTTAQYLRPLEGERLSVLVNNSSLSAV